MASGIFRKTRGKFFLLLASLVAVSVTLAGCSSSDSYDTPKTTADSPAVKGAATNVLIEPATLKQWMDGGLVNSDGSFDQKVVILDYADYEMDADKDPERIKGACRVDKGELVGKRFEGVADATPLVATGEQIDAVMQQLGIDENTTIVFTTKDTMYYATRAYWTFRYWGFPKERLKVLDGVNTGFAAAYPEMMTKAVPSPVASDYSVKKLAGVNTDLRASVGEFLQILDGLPTDTGNIVIDARGDAYYKGTAATSALITGDVVLFDGHPEGGQFLGQGSLFKDGKFLSAAEIKALFEAKGWTADKKATVYCTSGYSATPLFFALDTILGADVQLYDGSWSQFGKYSDWAAMGGELPAGSAWSGDQYLDVAASEFNYNTEIASPLTIETLDAAAAVAPQTAPFTGDVPADDSDVVQSQVEAADSAYADGTGPVTIAAPVATATGSVLIDAATLQGWMDAGLLNKAAGSERVVLLDATKADAYAAGHIPGAQLWDVSKQVVTRTEGPAPAVNMILDGASMDAMIQAAGIDENTTVVITSSQTATYFPSRAYFLFRYWGFPKERIKVLDGYNWAWNQNLLVTAATDLDDTTLSVADLASGAQLNTRVSLAELMDAVRDGRGTAVDFRGNKSATGSTAGVFSAVADDYVVFEGTPKGGKSFGWKEFNVDYDAKDFRFKSAAEISTALAGAGITTSTDGSNPIYSYCRTGYIASTGFFVLDGILGVDVMAYDGSWSQWGKMSDDATKGGELAAGSAWATDSLTYMDVVNYNVDHLKKVEALNPDADALDLAPGDAAANQVESADEAYQAEGAGEAASSGAPDPSAPAVGGC